MSDSNQKAINTLIKRMSGQANILTIPRVYIDLFDGDIKAALLLSQCVYWSDKGRDGWFYKSAVEWEEELGIKSHCLERLQKVIAPYVEQEVHRANAKPTTHYRVNMDILAEALVSRFAPTGHIVLPQPGKTEMPQPGKSLTETTHRLEAGGATPALPSQPPGAEADQPSPTTELSDNSGYTQSNPLRANLGEGQTVEKFAFFVCPHCGARNVCTKKTFTGECASCHVPIMLDDDAGGELKLTNFVTYYPTTPGAMYLAHAMKARPIGRRWNAFANVVEKRKWEEIETSVGLERMKERVDWAIAAGIGRNAVVNAILVYITKQESDQKEFTAPTSKPKPVETNEQRLQRLKGAWYNFGVGNWDLVQKGFGQHPHDLFNTLAATEPALFEQVANQTVAQWNEFMATKPSRSLT